MDTQDRPDGPAAGSEANNHPTHGTDGQVSRGASDRSARLLRRGKGVIGLLGLLGLGVAAWAMTRDASEQALPGVPALVGATALQLLALALGAQAWISLFPPAANRAALARGLFVSQLTKYLPAGGFLQTASQVTLSSGEAGLAAAAVRLPVFALCFVVAGATCGSLLVFNADLTAWARMVAGLGLFAIAALDRRLSQACLRLARRFVGRLPDPASLPSQRSILRCFGFALGNMAAFAAAFVVLLSDLADVNPVMAGAAAAAGWAVGYLVLPLPGGLGVRELVMVAALPGVPAGSLLAASVAHRLLALLAEAILAGGSQRVVRRRNRRPTAGSARRDAR